MSHSGESKETGRSRGKGRHAPDTGQASAETRQAGDRAFSTEYAPPPGPRRVISSQERKGVPATDSTAASPLGVGVSAGRRAEDTALREQEKGRKTMGYEGKSRRPYGTSDAGDTTGVRPRQPVHSGSPHLPPD